MFSPCPCCSFIVAAMAYRKRGQNLAAKALAQHGSNSFAAGSAPHSPAAPARSLSSSHSPPPAHTRTAAAKKAAKHAAPTDHPTVTADHNKRQKLSHSPQQTTQAEQTSYSQDSNADAAKCKYTQHGSDAKHQPQIWTQKRLQHMYMRDRKDVYLLRIIFSLYVDVCCCLDL